MFQLIEHITSTLNHGVRSTSERTPRQLTFEQVTFRREEERCHRECAYRLVLVSSDCVFYDVFSNVRPKICTDRDAFLVPNALRIMRGCLSMFFQMSDRNFVVLPGSSLHTFYAMLADFASQTHDVCLLCAQVFSCHALL